MREKVSQIPELTRRQSLLLLTGSGLSLLSGSWGIRPSALDMVPPLIRPEKIGLTVSRLQSEYYDFPHEPFLEACLELNVDIVRLCAYWNRLEYRQDKYNFDSLIREVEIIEEHNLKRKGNTVEIVVAGDIFSPSQPEYHISPYIYEKAGGKEKVLRKDRALDEDKFLAERSLLFTRRLVRTLNPYPSVKVHQRGNESENALPTAGGLYIGDEHQAALVQATKDEKRPDQKILLASAVYPFPYLNSDVEIYKRAIKQADIASINVYGAMLIPILGQLEPRFEYWQKIAEIHKLAIASGKEAWISELQAEPWTIDPLDKMRKPIHTSSSPYKTGVLMREVAKAGYDTVILWGVWHWYYWLLRGNRVWWDGMAKMIATPKASQLITI